jgi:hypothetical protein
MAQIPHAEPGKVCPLHQKDMSKVCHTCPWWTLLRGTSPLTGKEVDEWGCAISLLPILLCETAKEVRQGAAATESCRNDLVSIGLAQVNLARGVAPDTQPTTRIDVNLNVDKKPAIIDMLGDTRPVALIGNERG